MNLSPAELEIPPDLAERYAKWHDWMYAESIRLGRTPIPKELEDPKEWRRFCHWKHLNWLKFARASADKYIARLDREEAEAKAKPRAALLAESPAAYPSKT